MEVLFSQLIDVRPWGPQDRILPGAIAAWQDDIARAPDALVRLEVELWYHENAEKRTQAFQALEGDIVAAVGWSCTTP